MLTSRALALEDVLASYNSPNYKVESPLWIKRTGRFGSFKNFTEWLWLTRVKPVSCRALAIVLALMSCLVVLGEITLFIEAPVGLFPLMFRQPHGPVVTQLLVILPLSYFFLCTCSSLFYLKLQGFYGLYQNNMTDPSNLAWSASFLAKIAAPLCYNFLKFIKVSGTQFYEVMGGYQFQYLSEEFVIYFPSLLLVLVLLNYFNFYSKLMKSLGMSQFSFSESFNDTKILEGKSLLAKARQDKMREHKNPPVAVAQSPAKWELSNFGVVEEPSRYTSGKEDKSLYQKLRQDYSY